MFKNKVSLKDAFNSLKDSKEPFVTVFKHGTLAIEIYKPDKVDLQKPHDRDEVYIVSGGAGSFVLEGEVTTVSNGDFLFVPAGAEHRFVDFTDDFSTWVIFYGPIGGEQDI